MRDKSNIEDMIKALKCVASQIPSGDCHADIENFKHRDDADFKSVVCTDSEKPRDLINGGEGQCCPYYQKTYGCCFEDGELYWLDDVAKLLEELKEYRNLSKQGRLLRLPCKVGDTVYKITRNFISEYKIISETIYPYSIQFNWQCTKGIYGNLVGFADREIGETVFLTREEAEAKLKELETT